MRKIETWKDLTSALRLGPYTSVGAYPFFFVNNDGEALSYKAVQKDALHYGREFKERTHITGLAINWESELYCGATGEPIERAYE